jgi:type II secretory pathway component PulK
MARYGCDSGVKYALATLQDITPKLISRPNVPDFSDLFVLSEEEYQELLAEWADELRYSSFGETDDFSDINDINDINDVNDVNSAADFDDPNSRTIPGPYGPSWPLVVKPREFQIGSATVKIQIEDENAKYPLGWAMLANKELQREAEVGFETFCEWMDVNEVDIESVREQLQQVGEIRLFKLVFKSKKTRVRAIDRSTQSTRRRGGRPRYKYKTRTIPVSKQVAQQAEDFSKLFHSSLLDADLLARPTIVSESRKESPLNYMCLWASRRVNINTAPRHVLEAAFSFGGDADRIAHEIIRRRRIKPFVDISELKSTLLGYSDSIKECEKFVTTTSSFFTIRVTAASGVAEASTVIGIMKMGNKMKKIAIISG